MAISQVFSYIFYENNYVKHIFFKKGKHTRFNILQMMALSMLQKETKEKKINDCIFSCQSGLLWLYLFNQFINFHFRLENAFLLYFYRPDTFKYKQIVDFLLSATSCMIKSQPPLRRSLFALLQQILNRLVFIIDVVRNPNTAL